jgi:membrane protease YdiL (CAAX protease family)
MVEPPQKRPPLSDMVWVYAVSIALIVALKNLKSVEFVQRNLLLFAALVFIALPVIAARLRDEPLDTYGIGSRRAPFEIGFALLMALVIFPPFVAGYHVYQQVWFNHAPHLAWPRNLYAISVTHLLLVALPEELFYRGFIQEKLRRALPGGVRLLGATFGPAIILTAALFALGHFVVDFRPMRLGVFFPALLFGWIKERTGTITAPMLFHAMSNIFMATLEKTYFG